MGERARARKQSKAANSSSHWKVPGVLLALACLGGLLLAPRESIPEQRIIDTLRELEESWPRAEGWIDLDPQRIKADAGASASADRYLLKMEEWVRESITLYKDASPELRRVASYFTSFSFGIRMSRKLTLRSERYPKVAPRTPHHAMISFLPQPVFSEGNYDWGARWVEANGEVVVPAREWGHVVFSAVLFHELCHGVQDLADKEASYPSDTLPAARQEVGAYAAQEAVYNHATKREYRALMDKIIARSPDKGDVKEVLAQVQLADFAAFDRMIGCDMGERGIRHHVSSHHLILLGFRCLELRKASIDDKAAFYLWYKRLVDKI